MKKVAVFSLILSFIFSSTCFSMTKTYDVEEAGMSFTIDTDDYDFVFMDGNLVSSSGLIEFEDLYGASPEIYSQYMQENNLYFDAVSIDGFAEIYIRIEETDYSKSIYDFDNYTKYEIYKDFNSMAESSDYDEMLNELGISEENSNITEINDTIYYYLNGTANEVYATTYYTIKNGKSISISLNMYDSDKLDTYNDLLKNIVENISFTDIPNNQNTNNSEFLSDLALKVIGGCITGGVLGAIAAAIGRSRKNKNSEAAIVVPPVDKNNIQQDNTDKAINTAPADNYNSQLVNTEKLISGDSVSDNEKNTDYDIIDDKAAEYAVISYNFVKDYTPKFPVLGNIFNEIDTMICISFVFRFFSICLDKGDISKINRFFCTYLEAINYLVSENYGFSSEDMDKLIDDRLKFYDNDLLNSNFTLDEGIKIITDTFYHILYTNKENNHIKYDFSNNIDIDKYNNFSLDFYGAVMTMFAPIMKLTSKEIENLEQYLK